MATLEELQRMLIKAGDAGDDEAAKFIMQQMKGLQTSQPVAEQPTAEQPAGTIAGNPVYEALMKTEMDPAALERSVEANRNVRQYEELPWYAQPVVAASDVGKVMADSFTFGYGDKAAAKLRSMTEGGDYEQLLAENRERTQASRDRAGWAGTAAELTGGLKAGSMLANKGITLMGRGIPEASSLLTRLGLTAGAGTVEGAGYGALDAAGHDQDMLQGAVTGGLLGGTIAPAAEAIPSVVGGIMSKYRGTNDAPSLPQLTSQREAAYKAMEDSGVRYKGSTVRKLADDMNRDLVQATPGIRQVTAPSALDKIDEIDRMVQSVPSKTNKKVNVLKPVSIFDVDEMRKSVNRDVIGRPEGSEQHWGMKIRDKMDEMMMDTDPSKVLSGNIPADEAVQQLTRARDLATREGKVDDLQTMLRDAQLAVNKSESQTSTGQQMRDKLASVITKDKKAKFYTDDELASIEKAATGSIWGQLNRKAAKALSGNLSHALSGGIGGFLGNALMPGGTGTMGGIAAGAITAAGLKKAAQTFSESSTRRAFDKVIKEVARGRKDVPSRAEPLNIKGVDLMRSPKEVQDAVRMLILMGLQDRDQRDPASK